jgi:hypothetical protein
VLGSITVHDHKQSELRAHAEEIEAVLSGGVVPVVNNDGIVVRKGRLGFVEADAVLARVLACFGRAPFKAEVVHTTM